MFVRLENVGGSHLRESEILRISDFFSGSYNHIVGARQVFKRYSQMKLQMKGKALERINRQANEMPLDFGIAIVQ
jgi:hypothetical protein